MRGLARSVNIALLVVVGLALTAAVLLHLVPLTGRTLVVIAGGSMEPTIPIGSLLLIKPIDPGAGVAAGDVVTVRLDEARAPFTHRVIRTVDRSGATWLELQGDANADPDPVLVPRSAVVGRVTTVWPGLGHAVAVFRSPSGILVLIGVAGTLYALSLLLPGVGGARRLRPGASGSRKRHGVPGPSISGGSGLMLAGALLMAPVRPAADPSLARFVDTAGTTAAFAGGVLTQPTGLTISASLSLTATLSWPATPDAFAQGYRLFRSTTPGTGYVAVATIANPATTTTTDTPLVPGTYYYVVRVYVGGWSSAASNEVSATLL